MIRSPFSVGLVCVSFCQVHAASGTFDPASPGTIVSRQEARRIGWPCWSGPYQNFRAIACGHKLVDYLQQARLVWLSEEITPVAKAYSSKSGSYSGGRHGASQRGLYGGGGASPVVADGRVFLIYYRPADHTPWVEMPPGRRQKRIALLATDVVLCIDAYTGKTLWKKEFAGGPCYTGNKSAGNSGLSPCLYKGRVYSFCTGHVLRCLDAKTGQIVWETSLPVYGNRVRAYVEAIRDRKKFSVEDVGLSNAIKSTHFGSRQGQNLVCIGGVILVEGLLAFDAATGSLLWQKKISGYPVRWSCGGREYILIARNDIGRRSILCIEPRTGTEMWTAPFGGAPQDTMLGIAGNLIVGRAPGVTFTDARGRDTNEGLLAMWRIGPQGATLIWKHDVKTGFRIHSKNQPVLMDGLVYCGVHPPGTEPYPVACFDVGTGRHLGTIDVPSGRRPGNIMRIEDRLMILGDASHIKNTVFWAIASREQFGVAGRPWVNPHPPTTPLYATITWPYVDGLLFMRGADGIYCYDLRRNAQAGTSR